MNLQPTVERIAGEDINFTCVVSGNPPPVIYWTNNSQRLELVEVIETVTKDGVLPRISSTLALKGLNLENIGSYQCNATTFLVNVLSIVSGTSQLKLQCKLYKYCYVSLSISLMVIVNRSFRGLYISCFPCQRIW